MVNLTMSVGQEINKAIGIMRTVTSKAYGTNWHAVYEELPEDTVLVGIAAEDDELVCDGENVSEEDADFMTMMDPAMADLIITFLENVRDQDAKQKGKGYLPGRASAWRIAQHVISKFGKE